MTLPPASPPVPEKLADLLTGPRFGALGTVRPDGAVQINPMWFEFDGEHLLFTHTTFRAKFRNLQSNPAMTLLVVDPENPFRWLEARGELARIDPDPTGAYYVRLARRYGNPDQTPPPDSPDRVVLVMRIEHIAHG